MVRLIPLKCPQCGAKLKVAEDDVLTQCLHCRLACELSGDSVYRLDQALVTVQGQPDLRLPLWLLPCQAKASRMEARAVQSIFQSRPDIMTPRAKTNRETLKLPGRVLVAAFGTTNFINYTGNLSFELTNRLQGEVSLSPADEGVDYRSCRYGRRDAQGMAEVLLTMMANRNSPEIVDLDLDIKWSQPRLLWWPFAGDGDCWRDMLFGQRLLRSALG